MTQPQSSLAEWLAGAARSREQAGTVRVRRMLSPAGPAQLRLDGRTLVNFSSNDYLGLAGDPAVIEAAQHGAREHGVGSGASALVTGYREPHAALERDLAEFFGYPRVLLFPSGYHANLAALTALAGRGDVIVQDRLCHASLIDGARLSGADLRRYHHVDVAGLEQQLERGCGGHCLVVTDGVFSMDGDSAPLAELSETCRRHRAWLVVDDAHGIGVMGPRGRGTVAASGLGVDDVPVLIGTLGKAFGCAGAFVAGSAALVKHLFNEGRSYLFTTAMSPALAAGAREALVRVREDGWRREALFARIRQFREGAVTRGLPLLESDSPIQPLVVGDSERAVALSDRLREQGLLVAAIRPPTVRPGTARLRITLSSAHEAAQVDALLAALEQCQGQS